MAYAYRQGFTAFFKEHTQALSKGRFWLDEDSDCELGEPMLIDSGQTGYAANPIKKQRIKSYDNVTPGAEEVIGVSLDIRSVMTGATDDEKIMRPDYYWPREITVMQIGICPIVNTATGYEAQINDKAVPSDGGAQSFGAPGVSTGFTLGKWLQRTPAQTPGLVWVNPMMEVL
jgi:hypothetical protein